MITAAADGAVAASPRTPALPRDVAMRLAAREYELFVAQLRDLSAVGLKPVVLMVLETVFLALLVLGLLHWAS